MEVDQRCTYNRMPMVTVHEDVSQSNTGDKAAQVGLRKIQEIDSEEDDVTVLGSKEKFSSFIPDIEKQISLIEPKRKKHKKCKCVSLGSTIGTGTCASGFYISFLGCMLASCATGSEALLMYGTFSVLLGGLPCAVATIGSRMCWVLQARAIDGLDKDEMTLKQALKDLRDPEYVAFIDSQHYENLEELLILPDFYRYVEVCVQMKKNWGYEKSNNHPASTKTLEDQLVLRVEEEILGISLSEKIEGGFKRFDITKEE